MADFEVLDRDKEWIDVISKYLEHASAYDTIEQIIEALVDSIRQEVKRPSQFGQRIIFRDESKVE